MWHKHFTDSACLREHDQLRLKYCSITQKPGPPLPVQNPPSTTEALYYRKPPHTLPLAGNPAQTGPRDTAPSELTASPAAVNQGLQTKGKGRSPSWNS